MTRRLFTLGVVVAILLGADVACRGFVSAAVTDRAQQQAPPGASVSADVGGFPFLPPLLLSGTVTRATVRIEQFPAELLVFDEVSVELRGLHVDRGQLLNRRKARITKIDRGTVRATITEAGLRTALQGVAVSISPGKLTIAGRDVVPTVRGKQLAVGPLTVPLGALAKYMPCVGDVSLEEGEMQLSCAIDAVPAAFLDAVHDTIDR